MSVTSTVIGETDLDLSDPKLIENRLAPALTDRLSSAFPAFTQAGTAVASIMNAYKNLTAATTIIGAVGVAVGAVGAAAGYLEGRLDKDIDGNAKRWEKARNRTIARWIKPGDWATAVYAGGRPAGKVDCYNNVGGWSEEDFLAQYNEGIVWMSHRTARSDILLPTWESPPYTEGFGFMSGDKGYTFPAWSPLSGFSVGKRVHRLGQPPVAPIPGKYDDIYFGTLPAATLVELKDAGLEGAPKFLQSLILKMEAAFLNMPFIPPPDYTYLFSVGTYPYTSWSTANNGRPGPTQTTTQNGSMAAIAAAIHSLTPIHALVRSNEVEQCYRHWLRCTRLRQLPPVPKRQIESGVYLDEDRLPWSPNEYDLIWCVQPATGPEPPLQTQYQRDAVKRCADNPKLAEVVNSGCHPAGLRGAPGVTWQAAREIEQSFRSFFAIRRAALFQMGLTTPDFREAAKKSADPVMAAAARGKVPEYRPWNVADPLGDGWVKKDDKGTPVKPKFGQKVPAKPPAKPSKLAPKPIARPSTNSELYKLAIVGVTAIAALGYSERARLRAWGKRLVQRFRGRV